jgi:hypothetical protein
VLLYVVTLIRFVNNIFAVVLFYAGIILYFFIAKLLNISEAIMVWEKLYATVFHSRVET